MLNFKFVYHSISHKLSFVGCQISQFVYLISPLFLVVNAMLHFLTRTKKTKEYGSPIQQLRGLRWRSAVILPVVHRWHSTNQLTHCCYKHSVHAPTCTIVYAWRRSPLFANSLSRSWSPLPPATTDEFLVLLPTLWALIWEFCFTGSVYQKYWRELSVRLFIT